MTKESKIIAELRAQKGTLVVSLVKELLEEKLKKYKDRLVVQDDQNVRGRAQECIDLLKFLDNDLI
jgi:hypothetical protein